ncbi:MAG: aminoglycoside phosphotransferase family protein [Chloroflexi bacterium]|nr:aminoglycoside phosphotransferase family protein [Chloroflexota bacterium]
MEYITLAQDSEDASVALNEVQILALCQRGLGPHVAVRTVRELAGGTFNATYLVELADATKVILRVAPPVEVEPNWEDAWLMRREVAIQPYFSSIATLMPKILAVDFTHQIIARDYMFQTFIAGERWDGLEESLLPAENEQLWQQFGAIVKQIHATTGNQFGWLAPGQQFATWRETVFYHFEQTVQAMLANQLDVTHFMAAFDIARAQVAVLDEIKLPCLLHGDLWPFNVLVQRNAAGPKLVGILDADRAWWGDPLADWTMFLLAIRRDELASQPVQAAFWEGYGEVADTPNVRLREEIYKAMYFGNVALWHAGRGEQYVVDRAQAELQAIVQTLSA